MSKFVTVLLSCAALMLPALAYQPASEKDFTRQVEALLAMPSQERVAYLKNTDPRERRGLWFQLKKEEKARQGEITTKNESLNPFSVDAEVPASFLATREMAGSIIYDDGLAGVGFAPGSPFIIGNRFNSHTGLPMLTSGTLSTVRAVVVPGPGAPASASAGFVMLGPQTTMGGAIAIFSTFGVANGLIDSVSFTGIAASYTGTEFYVLFGAFTSSFVPVFGAGTVNGQGHHAINGNTGGMGPNITATSPLTTGAQNLNGLIRVTGNILPVELMKFEIE